jgi:hypothetical protein
MLLPSTWRLSSRRQVQNRCVVGVTFEDRGEHFVKGVADPIRIFAVRSGS